MSKDIEKLIKIQGAINRNMYHLHVQIWKIITNGYYFYIIQIRKII